MRSYRGVKLTWNAISPGVRQGESRYVKVSEGESGCVHTPCHLLQQRPAGRQLVRQLHHLHLVYIIFIMLLWQC